LGLTFSWIILDLATIIIAAINNDRIISEALIKSFMLNNDVEYRFTVLRMGRDVNARSIIILVNVHQNNEYDLNVNISNIEDRVNISFSIYLWLMI